MRVTNYNSQEANMTSVGAFGFAYYGPADGVKHFGGTGAGRYVAAVQAFDEMTIIEVVPYEDSVADIPEEGFTLPSGMTLLLHAREVIVSAGSGIVYFGGDQCV